MIEVVDLQVLDNYYIWIKFNTGEEKTINFKPFVGKGFTADLLDPENFSRVTLEPGGGIAWYNGYDFCPNFLKELEENKIHA